MTQRWMDKIPSQDNVVGDAQKGVTGAAQVAREPSVVCAVGLDLLPRGTCQSTFVVMLHNVTTHVKGWFTKRASYDPRSCSSVPPVPETVHVDHIQPLFPSLITDPSTVLSPASSSATALLPKAKARLVHRVDDHTIVCSRVAVEDLNPTHHFA
ncbi:hypothetical protein DYB25_010316, partial [Aphanomyces astaci]